MFSLELANMVAAINSSGEDPLKALGLISRGRRVKAAIDIFWIPNTEWLSVSIS